MFWCDRRCDEKFGKIRNFVGSKHTPARGSAVCTTAARCCCHNGKSMLNGLLVMFLCCLVPSHVLVITGTDHQNLEPVLILARFISTYFFSYNIIYSTNRALFILTAEQSPRSNDCERYSLISGTLSSTLVSQVNSWRLHSRCTHMYTASEVRIQSLAHA